MKTPQKPFDSYKWRWLSVQPSEGLLVAPVFLGVLRALKANEGEAFSSTSLKDSLEVVQEETKTNLTLARDTSRNLFRNSGQYWRGTGLLSDSSGVIELTELGEKVAGGELTNDEFAAMMIRDTVLPNPRTYKYSEIKKWKDADLRIRPLELILSVMTILGEGGGKQEAYLTPNELIKIVIPLCGSKAPLDVIGLAVAKHRRGDLNISGWPDCAPAANDKRLAREFLLFLANFDVCVEDETGGTYDRKFSFLQGYQQLPDLSAPSFLEIPDLPLSQITDVESSEIPLIIERMRVTANVLNRPNQARFRREVLAASQGTCILTNETTPDVLEAAHIIPMKHGGEDIKENGFCMRVDVHRLFDAGKIRIDASGQVTLNDSIKSAVSYSALADQVALPNQKTRDCVDWRYQYL